MSTPEDQAAEAKYDNSPLMRDLPHIQGIIRDVIAARNPGLVFTLNIRPDREKEIWVRHFSYANGPNLEINFEFVNCSGTTVKRDHSTSIWDNGGKFSLSGERQHRFSKTHKLAEYVGEYLAGSVRGHNNRLKMSNEEAALKAEAISTFGEIYSKGHESEFFLVKREEENEKSVAIRPFRWGKTTLHHVLRINGSFTADQVKRIFQIVSEDATVGGSRDMFLEKL